MGRRTPFFCFYCCTRKGSATCRQGPQASRCRRICRRGPNNYSPTSTFFVKHMPIKQHMVARIKIPRADHNIAVAHSPVYDHRHWGCHTSSPSRALEKLHVCGVGYTRFPSLSLALQDLGQVWAGAHGGGTDGPSRAFFLHVWSMYCSSRNHGGTGHRRLRSRCSVARARKPGLSVACPGHVHGGDEHLP